MTLEYVMDKEGGCIPIRAHTIVMSVQHDKAVTNEQMAKDLMEHVIKVRGKMDLTKGHFENILNQIPCTQYTHFFADDVCQEEF